MKRKFNEISREISELGPFFGFVAAVGGATLFGSAALALAVATKSSSVVGTIFPFLLSLPIAAMFMTVVAVCFGIPFSWLMARLNAEGPITYGVGGFLIGFCVFPGDTPTDALTFVNKTCGGLYGLACAILWWHFNRKWRQR